MSTGLKHEPSAHNHLTSEPPVKARSPSARDVAVLRRIDGGRMLRNGVRPTDVALALGVSRTTVYAWKAVLDAGGGLTGLRKMSRGGRPSRLSDDQVAWLHRAVIRDAPEKHGIVPAKWGLPAKCWTAALICLLVKQKFRVEISEVQIRRLIGPLRAN